MPPCIRREEWETSIILWEKCWYSRVARKNFQEVLNFIKLGEKGGEEWFTAVYYESSEKSLWIVHTHTLIHKGTQLFGSTLISMQLVCKILGWRNFLVEKSFFTENVGSENHWGRKICGLYASVQGEFCENSVVYSVHHLKIWKYNVSFIPQPGLMIGIIEFLHS